MHDLEPPLCAAHRGMLGARAGNQNATKHGFYRKTLTLEEFADLLTHAENTTLNDELAITRVMLRRLMFYLSDDNDLTPAEYAAIAPLVFTGSRTVAYILREIGQVGTSNIFGEVLDHMAAELGIDV